MAGQVPEWLYLKSSVYPLVHSSETRSKTYSVVESDYLEWGHKKKDFFRGEYGWDR